LSHFGAVEVEVWCGSKKKCRNKNQRIVMNQARKKREIFVELVCQILQLTKKIGSSANTALSLRL